MIFIVKLEKFQNRNKKDKKPKSFTPYFNYDIKTAYYNISNNGKYKSLTIKDEKIILHRLTKLGIIFPTFNRGCILLCADFENSKDIAFIIDASRDFGEQIIYYCKSCGNETKKSKKHDFCKDCYKKNREESEKERLKKLYLNSRK